MRTRIWNELTKTKNDIEYLRVYSLFQEKISRTINISIVVFSSTGVLSWGFFKDPKFIGIACAVTAGISLIKLISPYIILSEKDARKLDEYYSSMIQFYGLLEKFWYEFENDKVDKDKVTDEFYRISAKINETKKKYADISIAHIGYLTKKARDKSNGYFVKTFNL